MGERVLMKGNEALAEAAIRAGCRYFFGYPITPQNELPAYLAKHLPKVGGTFVQAESEIGAISMVMGAASAGARVLTSSSGPGISLKQEGISYLAGSELPCVIVNIMRSGPGLGGILPSQGDYFQATRGGGHGDYRCLVLAPASIQEIVDLTIEAFALADKYRNPVLLLGDGTLGQMMEPVVFPEVQAEALPAKPWATTGKGEGKARLLTSLYLDPEAMEAHSRRLHAKYEQMVQAEVRYEAVAVEDADVLLVAYGTMARVAKSAVKRARAQGIKLGLIRPISLFPFPYAIIGEVASRVRGLLCLELSMGQMLDDVRIAVAGKAPVAFLGRPGGIYPTVSEILTAVSEQLPAPKVS